MLRSVLAAMILAVFVGACSSTAPSPSVPASTAATPAPAASASAQAPASAAPSGAASALDLKGMLPAKVGDVGLTAVQFSGDQLDATGAVDSRLKGLLTTLGRSVTDLTMAIAADPTRKSDLSVTALAVRGVPMDSFMASYVPLLQQNYGNNAVSHTLRAGRPVYVAQPPGGTAPQVLFPNNDVLFVVTGTDSKLVDQAVAALP